MSCQTLVIGGILIAVNKINKIAKSDHNSAFFKLANRYSNYTSTRINLSRSLVSRKIKKNLRGQRLFCRLTTPNPKHYHARRKQLSVRLICIVDDFIYYGNCKRENRYTHVQKFKTQSKSLHDISRLSLSKRVAFK